LQATESGVSFVGNTVQNFLTDNLFVAPVSYFHIATQQTPASARTFKTATANKPNKTVRQTCAAQGHVNKTDG
jgi:hypothetical protein